LVGVQLLRLEREGALLLRPPAPVLAACPGPSELEEPPELLLLPVDPAPELEAEPEPKPSRCCLLPVELAARKLTFSASFSAD
jgi:hypothetical protein